MIENRERDATMRDDKGEERGEEKRREKKCVAFVREWAEELKGGSGQKTRGWRRCIHMYVGYIANWVYLAS